MGIWSMELTRSRIGYGRIYPFRPLLNPLRDFKLDRPKSLPLTLEMVTQSVSSKRPTCHSCSKPARTCLCSRLKSPTLDNPISVAILQHSLEKKHPLNSSRIAAIGLKNFSVVSVSDVKFDAKFVVSINLDENCSGSAEIQSSSKPDFVGKDGILDDFLEYPEEEREMFVDFNGGFSCNPSGADSGSPAEAEVAFTIEKYGEISSFHHSSKALGRMQISDYNQLLACNSVIDEIRRGFVVEKLQRIRSSGSDVSKECEEFKITVPRGSVLLFPSEDAVGIEAIDFQVKNLIVLDGTWAKAKRMYNENPWLKLLPHLKLDLDKSSMYSEVRHQPKAGCLSTIESIVYAMKALGVNSDELDGLLDVFESMVADQRRCKIERLSEASVL